MRKKISSKIQMLENFVTALEMSAETLKKSPQLPSPKLNLQLKKLFIFYLMTFF